MNNEETLTLQNEFLQIRILPSFGGKISSLRSARTREEFLLPPLRVYRQVSRTAGFHEGDLGGFDECLPSVSICESASDEPPVPDHGDLWRSKWHIDSYDRPITIHADSFSRPLRLTRHSWLDGPSLVLDYDLLNLSDSPTTWLWSAHPLLRIEAGDRILLPDEIKEVVETGVGFIDQLDESLANLPEIVGRDVCGHADRDAIGAIHEQVWELAG